MNLCSYDYSGQNPSLTTLSFSSFFHHRGCCSKGAIVRFALRKLKNV